MPYDAAQYTNSVHEMLRVGDKEMLIKPRPIPMAFSESELG